MCVCVRGVGGVDMRMCVCADLNALHSINIEPERIYYRNFSPIVSAVCRGRRIIAATPHSRDTRASTGGHNELHM